MAILSKKMPSTMIGIVKPLTELRNQGLIRLRTFTENQVKPWHFDWPDLVVFGRNTEPLFDFVLEGILLAQIPTIYELDDNLWEVPDHLEIGKYHRSPERINQLEKYIACADLVRVYSPHVMERIQKINPNVKMVKAGVDFRLIPRWPNAYRHRDKIRIAYPTSRIEDDLYVVFIHAVQSILNKYSLQVEFHIWGNMPPELEGYSAVKVHPKISDYNRFMRRFSRMGFEIGLAPLIDTPFSISKTNNKFREYGASAVAGVYSNIGPYMDSVQHGVTGLLVDNTQQEWESAIETLIQDVEFRRNIQHNARREVFNSYHQNEIVNTWREEIQNLLALASQPDWIVEKEISLQLNQSEWSGLSFRTAEPPVSGVLKLEIQTKRNGRELRQPVTLVVSNQDQIEFRFLAIQDAIQKSSEIVVKLSGKKSTMDLLNLNDVQPIYGYYIEPETTI